MTRERLEVLSDRCLRRIAENEMVAFDEETDRQELVALILDALAEKREERFLANNAPVRVEETKFFVSQNEELPEDWESPGERAAGGEDDVLPDRYGETRLVLMLRDPFWAFAYWDISPAQTEEIQSCSRFQQLYLRCFEVDGEMPTENNLIDYFDIPIQFSDRSRYINLAHPESVYRAELIALLSPEKDEEDPETVLIVRSNPVRPPRSYVSFQGNSQSSGGELSDADQLIALSGLYESAGSDFGLAVEDGLGHGFGRGFGHGFGDSSSDSRRIISQEGARLMMKIEGEG